MEFDPRLTDLGVRLTINPNATWSLASAKYQDEHESSGKHHIYFSVLDAVGNPLPNLTCVVDWVGREPSDPPAQVVTDATGQANVPIYANLDITLKNGPYFAFVEDQNKSDVVRGMGLPELRHVCFLLTFAPKTTPTTLEEAVLAAARKYTWMPINTDAALYKFAQAHNLGYPQTDEFEITFSDKTYIGQVYNGGIVYVKQGDWDNVKWMKKPE
jgi:hypothetical protein